MSSIKCKNCGLNNFASDPECRRCGLSFTEPKKRKERRPSRFSIWSLLPVVVALAIVYYLYTGFSGTSQATPESNTNRPTQQQGLSRTKSDQQRAGHYGDAVKGSSSLKAHEQRTKETEKAMQQSGR